MGRGAGPWLALARQWLLAALVQLPLSATAAEVLQCSTLNGQTECLWVDDEPLYPGQGHAPRAGVDDAAVAEWNRRWGGCRWDGAGACRDYFGRVVELSPMARSPGNDEPGPPRVDRRVEGSVDQPLGVLGQ